MSVEAGFIRIHAIEFLVEPASGCAVGMMHWTVEWVVGRVAPCAPRWAIKPNGARGAARPTWPACLRDSDLFYTACEVNPATRGMSREGRELSCAIRELKSPNRH